MVATQPATRTLLRPFFVILAFMAHALSAFADEYTATYCFNDQQRDEKRNIIVTHIRRDHYQIIASENPALPRTPMSVTVLFPEQPPDTGFRSYIPEYGNSSTIHVRYQIYGQRSNLDFSYGALDYLTRASGTATIALPIPQIERLRIERLPGEEARPYDGYLLMEPFIHRASVDGTMDPVSWRGAWWAPLIGCRYDYRSFHIRGDVRLYNDTGHFVTAVPVVASVNVYDDERVQLESLTSLSEGAQQSSPLFSFNLSHMQTSSMSPAMSQAMNNIQAHLALQNPWSVFFFTLASIFVIQFAESAGKGSKG